SWIDASIRGMVRRGWMRISRRSSSIAPATRRRSWLGGRGSDEDAVLAVPLRIVQGRVRAPEQRILVRRGTRVARYPDRHGAAHVRAVTRHHAGRRDSDADA